MSARRTVADAVQDFVIPIPHQSFFGKPLDGGIFRDAAGAGDPDDFTLQVVELCDSFGADERVIHVGLHAANNDEGRTLDDRAHRRHAGDQGVVDVTPNQRRDGGGPASDEDSFDFQPFSREEAEIDPDDQG